MTGFTSMQTLSGSVMAKLERLRETADAQMRQKVETHALPGETFDQTKARLLAESAKSAQEAGNEATRRVNNSEAKSIAADQVPTEKSTTFRKAPKGDEQHDFFVPSLYDIGTRDSRCIMDVAVFRLSKKERRAGEVITYNLPDGVVTVSAGPAGMASVWDYDLILMAISHLTEAMNRYREGKGEKPGRTFRPHTSDVMKFLRRNPGGKQKLDLVDTCLRLNTTHIAIQRTTKNNGKKLTVSEGEPLISSYKVITNSETKHPEFLEIDIAKWMYEEVTQGKNPDVLTVHPDYFLIEPGIGRFVYRLARRAAGRTDATWTFKTIYERSGSTGTFYKFAENLRKIISSNSLPEYTIEEVPSKQGPALLMKNRNYIAPDA